MLFSICIIAIYFLLLRYVSFGVGFSKDKLFYELDRRLNITKSEVPFLYFEKLSNFDEFANDYIIQYSYQNLRIGDYGKSGSFSVNSINKLLGFNSYLNNRLPIDRLVFDNRSKYCKYWHYNIEQMPTITVIITMISEDSIILTRTITSILLNTPRKLLKEIFIIVNNDKLNPQFTKSAITTLIHFLKMGELNQNVYKLFSYYLDHLPIFYGEHFDINMIKVYITTDRFTLGHCNNLAIHNATGDVLVFLKSHIELGKNWLPPLLFPIMDNTDTISIPVFMKIDPKNFEFKGDIPMEMILWNAGLQTYIDIGSVNYIQNVDQTLPYKISLLNSHQFAISKIFMKKLGLFDSNYHSTSEINLDLTFKVLDCGGRILKVPCSNVYVLEKTIPDPTFEIFDQLYIRSNFHYKQKCLLKQIAERWLDKKSLSLFYKYHPLLLLDTCQNNSSGSYESSIQKPSLCSDQKFRIKKFSYKYHNYTLLNGNYKSVNIEQISIEHEMVKNIHFGNIKNEHYSVCLTIVQLQPLIGKLAIEYCREEPTVTSFRLDSNGYLHYEQFCIVLATFKDDQTFLAAYDCFNQFPGLLKWKYQNNQFKLDSRCLEYSLEFGVTLANCSSESVAQKWIWFH